MLQLCCYQSDFYSPQTAPLSPERCAPYHKTEQCYLWSSVLVWCQVRRSHIPQTGGPDKAALSIGNLEQLGDWLWTTNMCMQNPTRTPAQKSDSPIGQHLLNNPECAKDDRTERFQIVARARTEAHLRVVEAIFIHTQAPVLCKQKEYGMCKHCVCSDLDP